jgi:hypothetical protein
VAWLLYNPPEQPIHAIDLMAKIPEFYRKQLGLPSIADPVTGKVTSLSSGARIQERSLAIDDAQAMRAIFKKEKELEAILDSEDASEPEKAEALRELEEIYEFQKKHARRSTDSAARATRTVRQSIVRFHQNLLTAPDLSPFAEHLQKQIIIPSARSLTGSFTYEPPPGITWTNS